MSRRPLRLRVNFKLGSEVARLSDPAVSQVVLIGAGRYDYHEEIPAVAKNLAALQRLLTDSEYWGVSEENCVSIKDPESPAAVSKAVRAASAAAKSAGTLLVYFAGHGVVDPDDNSLVLCLEHTGVDYPHEDGVPFEWLRRAISRSAAGRRIIILDCCYAGRAGGPDLALLNSDAVEVANMADMSDTCLLVAAGRNARALASDGGEFTAFTGALLRVMRNGIDGGGPFLTVDSVWEQVRTTLAAARLPLPELRNRNAGGRMPLIRNVRGGNRDLAGSVVFAEPLAKDNDLTQGVFLVLRHDDTGSLAVRLTIQLTDVNNDFTGPWLQTFPQPDIYDGGPLARDGYIAVARLRPRASSLRFSPLADRIGTIALATPAAELDRCASDLWIFAGYFGWRAGELEAYIRDGELIRSDLSAADTLRIPALQRWHSLVARNDRAVGGRI